MKIFPEKKYIIDLENDKSKALVDLQKETLSDEQFIVKWNKIFIGKVSQNGFEINLARKSIGSFCVIKGTLEKKKGILEIQVSKIYKMIIGAFAIFLLSGIFISIAQNELEILMRILFSILVFRFVFIELGFILNSKKSLNKLTKVIGITKLKKTRHNTV